MYLPPSAGCQMFPDTTTYARSPSSLRKRITVPPPLNLGSIDENAEYDVGILDLGAETPSMLSPNLVDNNALVSQWAQAGVAVPRVPARRPTAKSSERERAQRKETMDRDCGICFEFAVVPCRTLCCGKIFCTEHLADWLHGPNAQGRCPNCENLCSLEASTLSLASPVLLDVPAINRRRAPSTDIPTPRQKSGVFPSSPLTSVQPRQNDTLPAPYAASEPRSHDLISSSSSSATISSHHSDDDARHLEHKLPMQLDVLATSTSTTPFATSWGAVSRLMSIVTFLMFIYKLLS